MPQSLARLNIHLAFSTKNRDRILRDGIRTSLHALYGGRIAKTGLSGCPY